MQRFTYKAVFLCLSTCMTAALPACAQASDDGPPKVLVIEREMLKPGKSGLTHERSESAFVKAMSEAKAPNHYFALDSLSGPTRSLFMLSYDSFADWEKQTAAMRQNKVLSAAFDRAQLNDGELLSGFDEAVLTLRPDLSLNKGSIRGTHYFEVTMFAVKPGHMHEFEELAKIYADSFRKIAPEAHWDTFELMYGNPVPNIPSGGIFIVFNTMKSLAETDKSMLDSAKFAGVLGADGLKKVQDLTASSIVLSTTSLFAINPRESYPPQEWIDAEPSFWKVPSQPAMTKKVAVKTGQ